MPTLGHMASSKIKTDLTTTKGTTQEWRLLSDRRWTILEIAEGWSSSVTNQAACIPTWISYHAFLFPVMGLFHLHRLHPKSLDCLLPSGVTWINPMESWEPESSHALRQLDRLGQDKKDYLTLVSVQQQTSGDFFFFLNYHNFISFAAL